MKRETICMHKNNRQMKICFIWTIDCLAYTPTHMCSTHSNMADLHKIWLKFPFSNIATKHETNFGTKTYQWNENRDDEQMKCCCIQPFPFHRYITHSTRRSGGSIQIFRRFLINTNKRILSPAKNISKHQTKQIHCHSIWTRGFYSPALSMLSEITCSCQNYEIFGWMNGNIPRLGVDWSKNYTV